MSLLRTKQIVVGTVLAYTGAPTGAEGQTFIHGPAEFTLSRGDMVKVIDIDRARAPDTPWAKVTVACLKGESAGRVGVVAIDFSAPLQRSWQSLTESGSMAPVRAPRSSGMRPSTTAYSVIDEKRASERISERPTVRPPAMQAKLG